MKNILFVFCFLPFLTMGQTGVLDLGGGLFQVVDTLSANYPIKVQYQKPTDSAGVVRYYERLAREAFSKERKALIEALEYRKEGELYVTKFDEFSKFNWQQVTRVKAVQDSLFKGNYIWVEAGTPTAVACIDGFRFRNGGIVAVIIETRNGAAYFKARRASDNKVFSFYSDNNRRWIGYAETDNERVFLRRQ